MVRLKTRDQTTKSVAVAKRLPVTVRRKLSMAAKDGGECRKRCLGCRWRAAKKEIAHRNEWHILERNFKSNRDTRLDCADNSWSCRAVRSPCLIGHWRSFAALSSLDAAIVVALITGYVSIVCVVLGAIANNRMTYLQKRNEYLRDHREKAYSKLISIFTKVQKGLKTSEEYSKAELLDDMYAFHESLMLWGSSKAIKMWAEWRNAASKSPSPQELLLAQEAIIIQLRKDMGQKGGLQKGDILKLFINDVDEAVLGK